MHAWTHPDTAVRGRRDRRRARGASAVEYALLMAGIAALVAVTVYSLGSTVGGKLGQDCGTVGGTMKSALRDSSAASCTN